MMHIAFFFFVVKTVKLLCVAHRSESYDGKNLCLTSCKETGAVCSGKNGNLACERTDLIHSSAVYTLFVNKEPTTDNLFLNLIDKFGKNNGEIRIFFGELFEDVVLNGLHLCVTNGLVIRVKSFHNGFFTIVENLIEHIVIKLAGRIIKFRLADLCNDFIDEYEELLYLFVSEHNRVVHIVVRYFLCARFNHNDLLFGSCDCQLENAFFSFFGCRVDDESVADHSDKCAADRSVPRDVRNGKSD